MLPWCQDEPDIYDLLSWDLPGLKPEGARRRRMAAGMTIKLNGIPCLRATPGRIYDAKSRLRKAAFDFRSLDPKNLINAVAAYCRLEPLAVARLWPEIEKDLFSQSPNL